jgi:hypothetical protein
MPVDIHMYLKFSDVQLFWNDFARRKCSHEEMKNWLNSRNAFYHAVQNLASSGMLSKNVKINGLNYNFSCSFIYVGNVVFHITGRI